MSNVSQWSTTAASNNSAPPNGAPEGQSPASVNDVIRENMSAVARMFKDTQGTLATTGSGNAYVLTTNTTNASLNDQALLVFKVDRANTGSATLNVDGLGAKTIQNLGANLSAAQLVANSIIAVTYNSTNDVYDVLTAIASGVEVSLAQVQSIAASL